MSSGGMPAQPEVPRLRGRAGGALTTPLSGDSTLTTAAESSIRASRSPGQRQNAAAALRMAVTPQASSESSASSTWKPAAVAAPPASPQSLRPVVGQTSFREPMVEVHHVPGRSTGNEELQQSLAGTLQRLCQLEEQRRRLYEEYDGMMSSAAPSATPSKSPLPARTAAAEEAATHIADGAAGAGGIGAKDAPGILRRSSSLPPTETSADSSRRALSAAGQRADAQLEELLQKSDRLRSLLADATTTP